ncbi:MAG: DUF4832 domain-containing protein [Chitinophagaceae bacterium]|nr:DUF4832 domain-containing protein [Chitinophagaceae bacterium]
MKQSTHKRLLIRQLPAMVVYLLAPLLLMACKKSSKGADPNEGFVEKQYQESTEIIANPERGFMYLFTVASEGAPLSKLELQRLKTEKVSLVHRNYYFEKFKDAPLSEKQLSLMQTDFDLLREAGLKVVLCFAYTGIEYVHYNGEEDAPLSTIEMHLDQLKPLFEANKDVIAFLQGGFVGPWGEWHSSTNNLTTPENMKKVLGKMMASIPAEIMLQVRTPAIKQAIFETKTPVDAGSAYSGQGSARVGHYNNCFLTGATDYGTYVDVEADKTYIANETLYVPAGGETCPPLEGTPSCEKAINEMKRLRWSYLNLNWYKPTIDAWKSSGCFEEFQRNMGYRLSLASVRFPGEVTKDKDLSIQINLKNSGYAPVYNRKTSSLVLKRQSDGAEHAFALTADIRKCKPSGTLAVDEKISLAGLPAGTYDLYLKIADASASLDNRPEYSIRMANTGVEYTDKGLNKLNCQLKITTD